MKLKPKNRVFSDVIRLKIVCYNKIGKIMRSHNRTYVKLKHRYKSIFFELKTANIFDVHKSMYFYDVRKTQLFRKSTLFFYVPAPVL